MPSVPRHPSTLPPLPHGATARRVDWLLLPPTTRRFVEQRLGSPVADAESMGAGFTPGLAAVLTLRDGRRVFLKAANTKAQRPFADCLADEVRVLRALPRGLPTTRLLWSAEHDLWRLLVLEYVEGVNPQRPWRADDLDACLDSLEVIADRLTPPPLRLRTFAEDFADCLRGWEHVRRTAPQWPHLEEAAALAARFAEVTAGGSTVHTDVRDDNLLLAADRGAVLCDWNWPVVGAAWIDTVLLLIGAHGDGIDVEGPMARRRLVRHVPQGHVDVLLALLAGYFLERRDQPTPHSSPHLRRHQDWYAEAAWDWLARRRGWR